MKFYLSSYKIGNEVSKLQDLIPANNRIGYIPNAKDFTGADPVKKNFYTEKEMKELTDIGFESELLDLKNYFGKEEQLQRKINELGALWVSGGNVFVLRQAMKLSGLDNILKNSNLKEDFLYAGYSAGPCVLSPTLKAYQIVDDALDTPYDELKQQVWEGLGLIAYTFLPHYNSNHPESADIDKEIKNCIENKILFKALRDGEVIIIE